MSLALLIGASPKRLRATPIVRVPAGVWTIRIFNLADSAMQLNAGGPILDIWDGCVVALTTACDLQVLFDKKGSEENLSVYIGK